MYYNILKFQSSNSGKSKSLPERHHVVDMKHDQFESKDSSAKNNFTQDKHVQKDLSSGGRPQAEESKIPQDAGTGDSDDTSLHKYIQVHEQVNRDPRLDMTMVHKDQSDDRPQAEERKIPQDAGTGDGDDTSLQKDIDDDLKIMVQAYHEQVNRDPSLDMTMAHKPMDPNLVCPICGKNFRIGEIQKFRKHFEECS